MNYVGKIFCSIVVTGLLACQFTHDKVDYSTDVKPILNKKCISCHGGVRQNGGFSLLIRDQALAATESGKPAIKPHDAKSSEMIKRLRSEDPEWRMPFEADALAEEEIEILEKWIDQGANWDLHWSYQPVRKVDPPQLLMGSLGPFAQNHPIDLFVLDKLRENGLNELSPCADKPTLLRRISLDLIGMPAPGHLKERYLSNKTKDAEEELIDGLLDLSQFGEKWASMWLDIARYADSKGYERDPHRNIWRYRDWVIRAFNEDKPYDQFVIEQLAGDMLENPTDDQLLATGFHRNTSTNDEGGTDNEEYRTYAVFDRVNTTWEGLMGTTMACVQCHSHPYDPFLHEDYYKSLAFFNNTRDGDTSPDYPLLRHFSKGDSIRLNHLVTWMGHHLSGKEVKEIERFIKTWQPAWHSIETDSFINSALYDMKYLGLRQRGSCRLPNINLTDKKTLYIRYRTDRNDGEWQLHLDKLDGRIILSENLPSTDGKWKIHQMELITESGMHDLFMTYQSSSVKENDDRPQVTFDWLRFDAISPPWDQSEGILYQKEFWDLLEKKTTTTPIMLENPNDMKRETHRFDRGNFMVKEEVVESGIPNIFGKWPDHLSQDRLGFAQWIVDEKNPLTARTWVNRIWSQLFGRGLVETLEDFGSQGAAPSHPKLLDWLAWQMVHTHQWSLKKLLKEVMLTKTYQQQSMASDRRIEVDPNNIYLGRGSRVRLTAEQIRDQALSVAGLLNHEMYGPSVMPFQPVQWNVPYSNERWRKSEGGQEHRRGIYTYWKRSSPYPAMMIFDAAERDVCSARRIQTNTPLHALVTLNDPVYMEAATHFGEFMYDSGKTIQERLSVGYERVFAKDISADEAEVFESFFKEVMDSFAEGHSDADKLLAYLDEKNNPELAGMVMVANAMMNMDAFIMKN